MSIKLCKGMAYDSLNSKTDHVNANHKRSSYLSTPYPYRISYFSGIIHDNFPKGLQSMSNLMGKYCSFITMTRIWNKCIYNC